MIKQSKMHQRVRRASGAMLALSAVLPLAALAQTADSSATTGAPQLETVTVTAQRKAESIKDVPLAVTQLRDEKLDVLMSGGGDIRALAAKVPSLNIESSNGRTFPRFYIRGYGNTDFSTFSSQPVSLVYDDVVQENAILKGFPIFDLADVEVLRGPQGTLFGRNTPAGVVKFESAKPELGKAGGYYNVSAGTHNTDNFDGAVNIPIGSDMALRVSTLRQHRDGYVTDTYNGQKLEGYNEHAERLQFLYQPNTDFNALFNVHERQTTGSARVFRANIIRKGSNDFAPGFDEDSVHTNGQNFQNLDTYGGSARLTWNLGDYTLHSITGYEQVGNYLSHGDIDGGAPGDTGVPFQVETGGGLSDLKQYTQEFRIESKYAGPLNWQGGIYYFDEDAQGYSNNFTTAGLVTTQTSHLASEQKNKAWAGYGSVSYAVNPDFMLRAGARYTYDKKDFATVQAVNVVQVGPKSVSESSNKPTYDVSGDYKLNQDVNVYARIATGFRAPSIAAASSSVPITVADAETITSYEAGVKADLFDKRARVAFSVYDYNVKNQQLTVVGGTSNVTKLINAAKTVGRGAEVDFEGFITKQFKVTAGGSYNFTKLEDPSLYVGACGQCTITNAKSINPVTGATQYSINGNPLPQAPKWILNATARYAIPVGDGEMFVYTDWSYRSKINFFLYESTEFTGKSLLEGGLRVGYQWDAGKYEVAAFGRNITNTTRVTGAIDFNNLTGFLNDPRMWGLQFKGNF